jgi:hypothetical protein
LGSFFRATQRASNLKKLMRLRVRVTSFLALKTVEYLGN